MLSAINTSEARSAVVRCGRCKAWWSQASYLVYTPRIDPTMQAEKDPELKLSEGADFR
jgi:hypothetical protein